MEVALLEAARGGDQDAFTRLVEPHRAPLHAHCYRMLGSLHDAEDALQDALLRAWRGLGGFEAGRPLRPWLYRIATNAALDVVAKRPRRVLPLDEGPSARPEAGPGEPIADGRWVEPYPGPVPEGFAGPEARYEQRESVELAFIVALQHLPARQRAVLILRDVLGFSAAEVADCLDTSVASVNSALQRARETAAARLPARSQQATLRSLGDDRLRTVVRDYVEAWERRDVEAMVAMLVEDATFAMPPMPSWFRGRREVVGFVTGAGRLELRSIVTSANGQPAIGWYLRHPRSDTFRPASLEVLTLDGPLVSGIVAFVFPELFPRFGLPMSLPAG